MKNENISNKETGSSTVEIRILLSDIKKGIVKFGWVVVALAVLLGGFQFYRSYVRFRPSYTVAATFTVYTENEVLSGDNGVSAYSFYYDRETADQLATVFPHIISDRILRQKVCEDLNVVSMPASVSAEVVEGTNMITLTAIGNDPELTYDTLIAVIDNYPSVAEYIIGRTKLVMINEPIIPTEPSNSGAWVSSVIYAALIGLVLGLAWIFIYAFMRKTIHSKDDIKDVLNQHCIGILPQVVFKKYRREINKNLLLTNPLIGSDFHESLRMLSSSIYGLLDGKEKTIMLTSTSPGEGKTVATVNLATFFSGDEKSVLVVDADLRNSGIKYMIEEGNFEKELLYDNEFFKIEHIERLGFDLLSFKSNVDTIQKITRSLKLKSMLATLKSEYNMVLVDTPPCGMISDATIIASAVDAVIYVVRQDFVHQSNIRTGISSLLETEVEFLGCILNGASGGGGGYYSYNGYYNNYRGGYSYRRGYYKKYGYSKKKD